MNSARPPIAMDIRYLGICCGAGPHHIRALAEALGRHPPASKYSADMSKHAFFGTNKRIKNVQREYRRQTLASNGAGARERIAT
jgi:betaine-homocysteine S-methyltransferase